eukprot:463325-Amphidinium_carterae.1
MAKLASEQVATKPDILMHHSRVFLTKHSKKWTASAEVLVHNKTHLYFPVLPVKPRTVNHYSRGYIVSSSPSNLSACKEMEPSVSVSMALYNASKLGVVKPIACKFFVNVPSEQQNISNNGHRNIKA